MRYLIFLLCTFCVLSGSHLLAQQTTSQQRVDDRVEAIRQRELADPKKAKLWLRGDSYERLVRLKVMRELKIDPAFYFTKADAEPLFAVNGRDTNVSQSANNQDETTIAINRKDKRIVVASANDADMYNNGMPIYRTSDGGNKWSKPSGKMRRVMPPDEYIPLGDPIITSGNDGNFYFAYLVANGASTEYTSNIFVAKSADGITWEHCGSVIPMGEEVDFEDKEMIVVDNSPASKWYGRLYILWNKFSAESGEPILTLASSDDRGQNWTVIPELAYGTSFPVIKVGPNGEVIAGSSQDHGTHVLQLSTDGGKSFTEIFSTEYTDLPTNVDYRPSLKGEYGPRVYPFVSFDVDQKTGTIHLISGTWGGESSQLLYQYSTNTGNTWSNAQIVGVANPASSDEHKDRFFPWVTVDQITGEVFVLYYSSENDSNNIMTTVMRQQLTSELTQHPLPLTQRSFDPRKISVGYTGTAFIGDYIGSDAFDSVYAACWTGTKGVGKDGEVFAYVANPVNPVDTSTSAVPVVINGTKPVISWISPNPSTGNKISVAYFSPADVHVRAELFSIDGKLAAGLYSGPVAEGASTLDLHIPPMAGGSYFLKVTSPLGTSERQIVITR